MPNPPREPAQPDASHSCNRFCIRGAAYNAATTHRPMKRPANPGSGFAEELCLDGAQFEASQIQAPLLKAAGCHVRLWRDKHPR